MSQPQKNGEVHGQKERMSKKRKERKAHNNIHSVFSQHKRETSDAPPPFYRPARRECNSNTDRQGDRKERSKEEPCDVPFSRLQKTLRMMEQQT